MPLTGEIYVNPILIKGPKGDDGVDGAGSWGAIAGTIEDQTDLMNYINAKLNKNLNLEINPNNGGGNQNINFYTAYNPIANSPNETWTQLQNFVEIDTDLDGLDFGTSGTAINVLTNYVKHIGLSDVGSISMIQNSFELGDGVNNFSCNGFSYSFGFGNANKVDMLGPIQGYGFQPNFDSDCTFNSSVYVNAFYDFSVISGNINAYSTLSASPTVTGINNNNSFQAININPTVTNFIGNAGFTGLGIYGNLGTFDTGNYYGVNVNSNATGVDNAFGVYSSVSNITATNKWAGYFEGDVQINGDLSFSGGLSIGALMAYASQAVVDGGGTPTSIHMLISSPTIGNNQTIANADTLGINTAMLLQVGNNSTVTSALTGIAALALPAVVVMGTGSTIDRVSGGTFAVSLDATATGGTIAELDLCRSVAIPNGITTISKLVGFKMDLPFGDSLFTESWGVYIDPAIGNYFAGGICIGGTPAFNYALEVNGDFFQNSGDIGFFGTTPVSQQPCSGSQTAGGSYSSTEQTMLQEVYDALLAYGLIA